MLGSRWIRMDFQCVFRPCEGWGGRIPPRQSAKASSASTGAGTGSVNAQCSQLSDGGRIQAMHFAVTRK